MREPSVQRSNPTEAILDLADDLGREAICELIRDFLDSLAITRRRMDELLAREDLEKLRLEAHSFKALCASYGFVGAVNQAEAIEEWEGACDSGEISGFITSLFQSIEQHRAGRRGGGK